MRTIESLRARHAAAERALIIAALDRAEWRLSTAARYLGIVPSSLQRLIATHEIEEYKTKSVGRGRPRIDETLR